MSIVTFSLPFPPSVNTAYPTSGKRRIKSSQLKAWIKEASISLIGIKPIKERVKITYEYDLPDLRLRDVANYEKVVTDLLVAKGTLQDDNFRYIKEITCRWSDKKGNIVYVLIESAPTFPVESTKRDS